MTMTSWQIAMLNDDVARAAAQQPSTVGKLFDSPAGLPTDGQRQTLDDCVSLALRYGGLTLPANCHILWKDAPFDVAPGGLRVDGDGSFTLALSVNRWDLRELAQTILHELCHLDDLASGRQLSRAELETRAVRFANDMVSRL